MISQDQRAEIIALGEFVQELESRVDEVAARSIAARANVFTGEVEDLGPIRLDLRLARAALARAALALVAPLREITCPTRVERARERVRSGDLVSMLADR